VRAHFRKLDSEGALQAGSIREEQQATHGPLSSWACQLTRARSFADGSMWAAGHRESPARTGM
jgi:hypothetical protein